MSGAGAGEGQGADAQQKALALQILACADALEPNRSEWSKLFLNGDALAPDFGALVKKKMRKLQLMLHPDKNVGSVMSDAHKTRWVALMSCDEVGLCQDSDDMPDERKRLIARLLVDPAKELARFRKSRALRVDEPPRSKKYREECAAFFRESDARAEAERLALRRDFAVPPWWASSGAASAPASASTSASATAAPPADAPPLQSGDPLAAPDGEAPGVAGVAGMVTRGIAAAMAPTEAAAPEAAASAPAPPHAPRKRAAPGVRPCPPFSPPVTRSLSLAAAAAAAAMPKIAMSKPNSPPRTRARAASGK